RATVRALGRNQLGRPRFPTDSVGPKEQTACPSRSPCPRRVLRTLPRYKERVRAKRGSSDWRRGAAGSPDPDKRAKRNSGLGGETCLAPGGGAAGEVGDSGVAGLVEETGGAGGARAAFADDEQVAVARDV